MNLPRLLQLVYAEPALILPEAHASIRHLLEVRLGDIEAALNPDGKREGSGICGDTIELPGMQIIGDVAHIPIAGAIGQKLSGFAKGKGAVDVEDISEEIDLAENNPDVKKILFDIDSPGGSVPGTPECADRIAAIRKPKYAFSNGLVASAAYWLAASTDAIFATRAASIGSIGVYLPIFDETRAFESQGIKVEIIKAGTLKGLGYPGTQLSDAGREYLQDRVNEIYAMFTSHVRAARGQEITDDTMQGQVFLAEEAARRGLIDEVVPSKSAALKLL